MPSKKPDSFLGWLGRQVGFVSKAIKTDVTKKSEPQPQEPNVVYRADNIEEAPHPEQPNITLRRTTIDEVIVEKDKPQMNSDERG
ncbi:MAG TPA: hypothetical protein VGR35_10315 [Tepidisphaeraceae bacterium]|nr:hypothetical protein [Tepidisphaeraceae bacterium]